MKIDIYGVEWQVYFVAHDDIAFVSDNKIYDGICHHSRAEIFISKDRTPQLVYPVIVHEITHAIHVQMLDGIKTEEKETLCFFLERYGKKIITLADEIFEKWQEEATK